MSARARYDRVWGQREARSMQRRVGSGGWWIALVLACAPALAHHSFAVFFQTDKTIEVTGLVTEFQFSNPHGLIRLTVKRPDGATETWTAETNSPSILTRRGWSKDTLQTGETITVRGWPARNGARYLRMQNALRNGQLIGKPYGSTED